VDEVAAAITAGILLVALAYFFLYSRHHLVANAPEEEFAAIKAPESELAD
jgi:ethanolamine permease